MKGEVGWGVVAVVTQLLYVRHDDSLGFKLLLFHIDSLTFLFQYDLVRYVAFIIVSIVSC